MSEVRVYLPEISDDQISNDLVWLTEQLSNRGAPISGGFLGGEFGYGADFENDVFRMHPFCWCEQDDCPWCWGCVCPDGADVYEVRDERVDFKTWLDEYAKSGNTVRSYRKDPTLACDYCRGERESAPNFLHKPTGTWVTWYKYIGRSMETDVRGEWRTVLADCVASLGAAPDADSGATVAVLPASGVSHESLDVRDPARPSEARTDGDAP